LQVCSSVEGKPKRLPKEFLNLLGPYLPVVE